ncbi:MAG: glycosyltransferase family 4 protein, partial [Desulfobacteraceae bacterium]|nr:glycosyltransferase family 4 protein [Desulfobacteraceae bacterium]
QRIEDEKLIKFRKWRLATVNYRRLGITETSRWLWTGLRKKIFEKILSPVTFHYGIAEHAQGREFSELSRLTCRYPADIYIAHHPEALGAAYWASKKHQAYFAFDAEDFHTGELPENINPSRSARIEYLERKYLPYCDYITAGSEGIADTLAQKYPIRHPEVILNVFPLENLPRHNSMLKDRKGDSPSLYWYSQVIGPGRGLEEAVLAAGKLKKPCQMHLRGMLLDGFDERLKELASKSDSPVRLYFHPLAPPEQLIQLAAEHDIGLALEIDDRLNRLLCVTNKLFVYMLARLSIVATDTPGQKSIMDQVPEAGIMCRIADVKSLANAIEKLISDPVKLTNARNASRQAAENRFNWDIEKKKLIRIAERCLEK